MRNMNDYTRVTEALKPFSGISYIDKDIVKNAADRGTCVHKLCDIIVCMGFLEEEEIDYNIKKYTRNDEHFTKEKKIVCKMVSGFDKWHVGKRFENKPERFFDDEYMITGECDLIFKDNEGKRVLVDIKTPVSFSSTWPLQCCAYAYMANKLNLKIDRTLVVQLPRNDSNAKEIYTDEKFERFLGALDMYRTFFKDVKSLINEDYI